MPRDTLLKEPSLGACRGCAALCCHDLWIPIAPPKTPAEIAEARWRLHFDTVELHIDEARGWLMRVKGRCTYLGDDNMCTIYDRRPKQCRDLSPPYCQRYMSEQKTILTSPEDLDSYLAGEGR